MHSHTSGLNGRTDINETLVEAVMIFWNTSAHKSEDMKTCRHPEGKYFVFGFAG